MLMFRYCLRILPVKRFGLSFVFRSRFISTDGTSRKHETINLEVGGNGHVKLDIFEPIVERKGTRRNAILVHLPQGLRSFDRQEDASFSIQDVTEALPEVTIINLNYRLSSQQPDHDDRFPTPIHDVFTAWDYVTDLSSPHNVRHGPGNAVDDEPQILLHGSHIGGALALTLALTNPLQVHALAITNPITDWVILDEYTETTAPTSALQRRAKSRSLPTDPAFLQARSRAAKTLIDVRTSLFRTPSGYFDSFASPTLFLRAPGRDTPLTRTAAPEQESEVMEVAETRYGEEDKDVGFVELDTATFGPYNDDYHDIAKMVEHSNHIDAPPPMTVLSSKDASSCQSDDSLHSSSQLSESTLLVSQPLSDLSLYQAPSEISASEVDRPPKRRKVVRRWPPNNRGESVLLPYINIFLQQCHVSQLDVLGGPRSVDLSPVLFSQGADLRDLAKRVCFWGREKGLADERVQLTHFDYSFDSALTHHGQDVTTDSEILEYIDKISSGVNKVKITDSSIERNRVLGWLEEKMLEE